MNELSTLGKENFQLNCSLIYTHDPMCSWCWGFEPVRKTLFESLPQGILVKRLLGGLAPDSSVDMPIEMQSLLKGTWQKIEKTIPGIKFNFDFWKKCQPRRSTYPSNRAVIAARLQHQRFDSLMTLRIQQAYYLQAKNPSDIELLIELSEEIGLDSQKFKNDISSSYVNELLSGEVRQTRQLGLNSFPSLAVIKGKVLTPIPLDYTNAESMLKQIENA